MYVWSTILDDSVKPFPGSHPLHGTEIIPAAVLLNTFLHASNTNSLKDVILRVPVAVSAPRDLQIVTEQGRIRLSSRLQKGEVEESVNYDNSWLTHTTAQLSSSNCGDVQLDIGATKLRLKTQLKASFSTDYLSSVGVPDMGFPWKVLEHYGDGEEMLSKVDTAPEYTDAIIPWSRTSWAPILDAATSIGSSIFYKEPILRMPAQIDEVTVTEGPIPKIIYVHSTFASGTWSVNVSIMNDSGCEVAYFKGMRFSAIEGTPGVSGSVESLVHQMCWPPAKFEEEPFQLKHVIFLSAQTDRLDLYVEDLKRRRISSTIVRTGDALPLEPREGSIVAYLPAGFESIHEDDVSKLSSAFCETLLDATKTILNNQTSLKVWCITNGIFQAETALSLAQSPLIGLSRIIASEQPEIWGGLVDTEDDTFPLQVIKYVKSADVISIRDSAARVARLRAIPRSQLVPGQDRFYTPRADGTYLITGGLGALGLEVASWRVEKGARRLILVSRRSLPHRRNWTEIDEGNEVIRKIKQLEVLGATIHILPVDVSQPDAMERLENGLDLLAVPAITGVVHAAGILEDQLVAETTRDAFDRVLAPKVSGAMALHKLFPVGSLDFMVLFSSCGQLLGFPGQASYASGNAFLDTLADYRRKQGDNTLSFLWTSWTGLGMASSTKYINAELEAKGITSVSKDEAFRAWEYTIKHDIHQAVVLRA